VGHIFCHPILAVIKVARRAGLFILTVKQKCCLKRNLITKTVDSRKGQYSKEHAIKLSGVRFNVGKKKDLSLLSCLVN